VKRWPDAVLLFRAHQVLQLTPSNLSETHFNISDSSTVKLFSVTWTYS